jgi:hypothetical protein
VTWCRHIKFDVRGVRARARQVLAMTDSHHAPALRRMPWPRILLVALLTAVGTCGGGLLGAWWSAPPANLWVRAPTKPGLVFDARGFSYEPQPDALALVEGDSKAAAVLEAAMEESWPRDCGRSSRPATYLGLATGALLGWLLSAAACWVGRRCRRRLRAGGRTAPA